MKQDNAAYDPASMSNDNRLLCAAAPLLNTIVQIRLAATHDDPAGLRQQLVSEIRQFEQRCKQENIPFEVIIGARYCLCSVLDEAASQTPWGSRGICSGNGLLVTFHNESWGGEKFFQLLSRLSQNPQQHLWLLEVIHYCLLLGYEGRYRTLDNGRTLRDGVRTRLARLIEETRDTIPEGLSPAISNTPYQRAHWRPPVPLWVCLAVAALIAGLVYSTFSWRLSERAAPLLSRLYQMPLPEQNISTSHTSTSQSLLDLHKRLGQLINDGTLRVIENASDSKVIIPSDALFDANSAHLTPAGRVLLARIAVAMDNVSGAILVSAWADRQPASDDRFATNYEYTLAQARGISNVLQQVMSQNTHSIRVEGRGNNPPSVGDTAHVQGALPARRIEITLYPSPGDDKPETGGAQ